MPPKTLVDKLLHGIGLQRRSVTTGVANPAQWLLDVMGIDSDGNTSIAESAALRISTVYSCINVLAETVAGLPLKKHRYRDQRTQVLEDAEAKLLHTSPDGQMTAYTFWHTMVTLLKGWGNAYAIIERNIYEKPIRYKLLHPSEVQVLETTSGEVFYRYKEQTIQAYNMLHLKGLSTYGLVGLSPIRQNAITMAEAQKLGRYGTKSIGERPPGLISSDLPLKKEQMDELLAGFEKQVKAGKTPVLGGGFKYAPFMVSPKDAEFILTRKYTKEEICGIFRVPPSMVQNYDRATYSNAEQQDLVFVKHTIAPLVRSIEQELNLKLLPMSNTGTFYKFNLNGLLRGDLNARKEFYQAMLNTAVFSPNMVLELEDMDGYEGGDRRYVQGAMIPTDLIDSHYQKETKKQLNGHSLH